MKTLLALEDGRTFTCRSFTGAGEAWGEVVFNTGMTGYQEVLTDPSYSGQLVTMTYPLVGNYGVNAEDIESERIQVAGFIIKEYQPFPSNFRATATLAEYLKTAGVLGIEDLDTRALTRHIRKAGAMRCFISTHNLDSESLVTKAKHIPSMVGQDLAQSVSTDKPYYWTNGKPRPFEKEAPVCDSSVWNQRGQKPAVVAFDFGIKYHILRCLETIGCDIVVVPAATRPEVVKAMAPDGIFLSNGPGDPEPVTDAIETIRSLLGYRPIFGICLGQQLLGLPAL